MWSVVVWQDIAGVVEYFEDLVISELVLGWALGRSMVNKKYSWEVPAWSGVVFGLVCVLEDPSEWVGGAG